MTAQPMKNQRSVVLEFWDCGNPNHHHRSQIIAQNCIDRQLRRQRAGVLLRRFEIALEVLRGKQLKIVAVQFNCGGEWVRRVVRWARNMVVEWRGVPAFETALGPDGPSLYEIRKHSDYYIPIIEELARTVEHPPETYTPDTFAAKFEEWIKQTARTNDP